jgi:hypothetical protein
MFPKTSFNPAKMNLSADHTAAGVPTVAKRLEDPIVTRADFVGWRFPNGTCKSTSFSFISGAGFLSLNSPTVVLLPRKHARDQG